MPFTVSQRFGPTKVRLPGSYQDVRIAVTGGGTAYTLLSFDSQGRPLTQPDGAPIVWPPPTPPLVCLLTDVEKSVFGDAAAIGGPAIRDTDTLLQPLIAVYGTDPSTNLIVVHSLDGAILDTSVSIADPSLTLISGAYYAAFDNFYFLVSDGAGNVNLMKVSPIPAILGNLGLGALVLPWGVEVVDTKDLLYAYNWQALIQYNLITDTVATTVAPPVVAGHAAARFAGYGAYVSSKNEIWVPVMAADSGSGLNNSFVYRYDADTMAEIGHFDLPRGAGNNQAVGLAYYSANDLIYVLQDVQFDSTKVYTYQSNRTASTIIALPAQATSALTSVMVVDENSNMLMVPIDDGTIANICVVSGTITGFTNTSFAQGARSGAYSSIMESVYYITPNVGLTQYGQP